LVRGTGGEVNEGYGWAVKQIIRLINLFEASPKIDCSIYK